MGRKFVPSSTIQQRINDKDFRFQSEAETKRLEQQAVKFILAHSAIMKRNDTPLTHEQRQELIRRPITFNYYGGKQWGGCASQQSLIPLSTGGGVDTHFDGENND